MSPLETRRGRMGNCEVSRCPGVVDRGVWVGLIKKLCI